MPHTLEIQHERLPSKWSVADKEKYRRRLSFCFDPFIHVTDNHCWIHKQYPAKKLSTMRAKFAVKCYGEFETQKWMIRHILFALHTDLLLWKHERVSLSHACHPDCCNPEHFVN